MKKRALMALPKLTATDEMKQIAASDLPRKEKIAYGYVQEVCEYYVYLRCITQDGILKVAFFFPEHLRIDGNSPAYEVYLDKEKRQFITYNSLNQKWCEAKLDRLDWKRRYWYTKAYWVSEEDETSIQAYLNINKKAVEAIRQFQRNVREEQLEQRHRRETDPWDKDMEQVPELPKDWNRWVDKVAIRQNYIYYHYKKGGAKTGYCTYCEKEVPIKVHIPPNIVTYERGIKNFVAGSLTASAHRLMIGAKITTTGVLFRNADTKATGGSILACALKTVVFPSGSSFLINWPKAPLCRTPSLTRKSMATVIIPLLLKPSSISLGVRMPTQRKNTTTVRRTIPGRILSHTKAAIMPIRASNTNTISKFIYLLLRAQK